MPYFEKAKTHEEFLLLGHLGRAKVFHALKQNENAVSAIVEVLTRIDKETPSNTRAEANSLFKKISPFKSVIYVYRFPYVGNVFVNDKKFVHKMPLFLSLLGL